MVHAMPVGARVRIIDHSSRPSLIGRTGIASECPDPDGLGAKAAAMGATVVVDLEPENEGDAWSPDWHLLPTEVELLAAGAEQ